MAQREQVNLEDYKNAIKDFAENWPQKAVAEIGRKETIKSATQSLALEVKLLVQKGYTASEVVEGLKGKGVTVSSATLKSFFATAKAELKAELKKDGEEKVSPKKAKAVTPAAKPTAKVTDTKPDNINTGKDTQPAKGADTNLTQKKTAGAQAADKNDY
jgi:hypothetical protein